MTEFVQHRSHPILVRHNIAENTDVPFPVDVGAKGVRALAGLFVEVAAGDDIFDRQTDPRIEFAAELENIGILVSGIEVCPGHSGWFLEERIVIMPWTQLLDGDTAVLGESRVDLTLRFAERLACELIEIVEKLEDSSLVLFVEKQLQHVVIAE